MTAVWDAFDGRPHAPRLGLHPMDERDWVVLDPPPGHAAELDRKAALLATHDDVYATDGSADDAAVEFRDLLIAHLTKTRRYRATDRDVHLLDDDRTWSINASEPLELAGRIVTEDWCLVRPGPPPTLAAAVVCSPNRWRLLEKIGCPVLDVHDPVPGYRHRLGRPVDSMMAGHGRPMWRRNWSILSSPARYQPFNDGPPHPRIPEQVWVRSEYETFVYLPISGWWVFGIHTTVRPITSADPAVRARIGIAVASLDPETAAYKDLSGWRDELLAWLGSTTAR